MNETKLVIVNSKAAVFRILSTAIHSNKSDCLTLLFVDSCFHLIKRMDFDITTEFSLTGRQLLPEKSASSATGVIVVIRHEGGNSESLALKYWSQAKHAFAETGVEPIDALVMTSDDIYSILLSRFGSRQAF